ncbi:hypothetical protein P7H60_09555 [Vagococcus carniphilus]|uniref:hypothetical protein n=1 Tax=Vagococcus carniphilus TaxID=218144 RepID=UPI00288E3F68|nr:hypothetical protein [Vagococcus carniphilus]MDT2814520.1 hypothetical protein [Vagococcus carniphilus]MDT2849402.1 hypothetical protein [Vagococcus carniphilus]MDT2864141.1 hypothetical protein [Vagococcus carniphilus]
MKNLENILTNRFEWNYIEPSEIQGSYISRELKNIHHYTENKYSQIDIINNTFIYNIKYNEVSKIYFSERLSHYNPVKDMNNNLILFVIIWESEEDRYLTGNSSKLVLDLLIELGITENDIKTKNNNYFNYKSAKEILNNYDKFI